MAFDPKKFLDSQGVTHLWKEIQKNLNDKIDSLDTEDIVTVSKTGKAITITGAIKEVDGLIQKGDAANVTLADVAATGNAEDVAIADAGNLINASTVEGALQEIASNINTNDAAAKVTVTKTTGGDNDNFAYRYQFSQGGTPLENGTIDLAKDMVATSGTLVTATPEHPIGEATSGQFIEMTIANGTPFYINVADLVDQNEFEDSAELDFSVNANGKVTATLKTASIARSKIDANFEANIKALEDKHAEGKTVAQEVADGIADLDSDYTAAGASAGANVTSTSTVNAISKVDIVNGKIASATSASVLADAAGAAAAAKSEVIGSSNDASSADTVYAAKKYTDEAYAAITALTNDEINAAIRAAANNNSQGE